MIKPFTTRILLLCICFSLVSCVSHWTDAIQQGEVDSKNFNEDITFSFENNLIILPVQINGKTYRFLLDTGAMTSISEEIQDELQFRTISKGNIVDSDKNRTSVDYVQVDDLMIGNIKFSNQTAFVSNMKANPILNCMKLDGILGSNTMRLCNWAFNFQEERLTINTRNNFEIPKNSLELPFETDKQYDILIPIGVGANKVRNLKLDTGSNSALTIPNSVFNKLKDSSRFTAVYTQKGEKQSGLFGKSVNMTRKITYSDSITIKELTMADVEVKTGSSGLVGNEISSRFNLSIDWNKRLLYFVPVSLSTNFNTTFGISIGMNKNGTFYIQAIIEESTAFQKGIRVGMIVNEINALKLNVPSATYCDYFQLMLERPSQLHLKLQDVNQAKIELTLQKENLKK